MYHILEERLRAIEGHNTFRLYAFDMCLVPNVIISPKFKVPEFEKYKGLNFPKNHLWMFFHKMDAYTRNEKLMIHYFQNNLSGASLD